MGLVLPSNPGQGARPGAKQTLQMMVTETAMKPAVLCIEDEPHLRQDIIDELLAAGYDAVGAGDGLEALIVLDKMQPALILCDISMPRLDGYALLDTVRNRRPDLADVPFVFLTAYNQRQEIISGKRAGADDYLVKPVDYDLMLATIEARLGQMHRIGTKVRLELDARPEALAASRADDETGMRSVLDILSFGVVLIARSGVVFANRTAKAIHDSHDGIVIDETLHSGSSHLAGDVRTLLADTLAAARDGNDHLSSLPVPRLSGQRDFLLIACALPAKSSAERDAAQIAVFISDPVMQPELPSRVLADLFELTPTEAAVARALAHGRRTDQVADDLGVSQTTVAFHLRNLFDKTGTRRQADLVALILTGLASIAPA